MKIHIEKLKTPRLLLYCKLLVRSHTISQKCVRGSRIEYFVAFFHRRVERSQFIDLSESYVNARFEVIDSFAYAGFVEFALEEHRCKVAGFVELALREHGCKVLIRPLHAIPHIPKR